MFAISLIVLSLECQSYVTSESFFLFAYLFACLFVCLKIVVLWESPKESVDLKDFHILLV